MSDSLTAVLKSGEKRKCHKCKAWFVVFRTGVYGKTSHICPECLHDVDLSRIPYSKRNR
jgi:hypothetical protein